MPCSRRARGIRRAVRCCASLVAGAGLAVVLCSCGEPGAPQPPSLNLPIPVRDLAATRTGNTVRLTWSTLARTTDHAPVTGTVRMRICRIEGTGPCELVTEEPARLGQPAQFDDGLPSEELQGPPLLLTYSIELLNHAQKSAGRSNAAYSASGQAAPELSSLTATVRPEGVELHWSSSGWPQADGGLRLVRITRLDQTPHQPKEPSRLQSKSLLTPGAPKTVPLETLEVDAAGLAGTENEALDRTARFGEAYRYEARCVEKLTLDGHAIEMAGASGQPISLITKDTFPPAVPQQLAAAPDIASHAIDLSWYPDSEADLAGYIVYRRGEGGGMAEPVSGAALLAAPSYHDEHVQTGVSYIYSVTAVDRSGNESAHSAEAAETLMAPR